MFNFKLMSKMHRRPQPMAPGLTDEMTDAVDLLDVTDRIESSVEADQACDAASSVYHSVSLALRPATPEEEAILAASPTFALCYARDKLLGAFPAGESAIAREADLAVDYAKLLGRPFPAGEAAIAQDALSSLRYARDVLKGRFVSGEAAIASNPFHGLAYARDVLEGPFPAAEAQIAQDAELAAAYAMDVLGRPFAAGEEAIDRDPQVQQAYANWVLSLDEAAA